MIEVTTFLTHDNVFSLKVLSNREPVDLVSTGVFRVVVKSATTLVDSNIDQAAFDFTTRGADGIIRFDFTDLPWDLPYDRHLCTLVIYDTAHPNGQVWDNKFYLNVMPKVI